MANVRKVYKMFITYNDRKNEPNLHYKYYINNILDLLASTLAKTRQAPPKSETLYYAETLCSLPSL